MQARQQVLTIFVSSSAAAAIGASAADAVDTSPPDSGCEKTAAAPLSAVASRKLRRVLIRRLGVVRRLLLAGCDAFAWWSPLFERASDEGHVVILGLHFKSFFGVALVLSN